jgi:hypothetical protein
VLVDAFFLENRSLFDFIETAALQHIQEKGGVYVDPFDGAKPAFEGGDRQPRPSVKLRAVSPPNGSGRFPRRPRYLLCPVIEELTFPWKRRIKYEYYMEFRMKAFLLLAT